MGILEDKGRARTFYKYLSKVYDTVNPVFWNEEMRGRALDLIEIESDDKVLDIGCGTGFATQGLIKHSSNVHALDQSEHQLEKALQKDGLDQVNFVRGDAEQLPYPDNEFDVIWSSGSIEYWPQPVETLREARRVTRDGGTILVVGPKRPDSRVLASLADAIMLFYDEDEAARMFDEAGWSNIENHLMGSDWVDDDAIVTTAVAKK
ncbi:MAG: methyltransferase domain-containing protein [Halobacteria archaeon]|nr:methyltransferase domain-containing protein [Halobacteria archaeon]